MKEEKEVVHDAEIVQENSMKEYWYSGFWVRGAASIIDGFIIGILIATIGFPIGFGLGFMAEIVDVLFVEIFVQFLSYLISLIIGWGYFVLMTYKFQATIGKMAVGAKVIAENGKKLTLKEVFLREILGKFLSGITLYVGYFMAGFTRKKRGLHDMIAQSVVVYTDMQNGPNRIAVWVVYGVYAFIVTFLLIIFGVIILFFGWIFMNETSQYQEGERYDKYEILGDTKFNLPNDCLINQL
ncbi:MAG: hypothetical protein CR972_00830 [Candidatus Moraniibacteriota bacterium]|nr:MAG: hypothetical protein CR972_00830 [Candidatus Moranbacteria bacterium]